MLDAIRDARQRWGKCIAHRMNSAPRRGVPWVRVRLDRESLPKALTPCYEDSDLLSAVTALCSPHNHKGDVATDDAHFFLRWGRVRVQLRRPLLRHSLSSIRRKCAMLPGWTTPTSHGTMPSIVTNLVGGSPQAAAAGAMGLGAQSLARCLMHWSCGSMRAVVCRRSSGPVCGSRYCEWTAGTASGHHAQDAFADLQRQCDGWELLVDKCVEESLRDTLDDDGVFEDKMREILSLTHCVSLCLSLSL
eukprot:COSAG03_NODE_1251_length_4472_cov_70.829636_4_plen_247_part_00